MITTSLRCYHRESLHRSRYHPAVQVRVLAFATAADALGAGEIAFELPEGSDVAELRRRLAAAHPALGPLWPRLAVAVDGRIAGDGEALAPGAEVALLPPVSGGAAAGPGVEAPPAAPPLDRAELTGLVEGPLPVAAAEAAVAHPGCGAVVVFLGTVRDRHAGRAVAGITYTAYRAMAAAVLRGIAADLEAAAPGLRAAIVHRLGRLDVGEASVVIATAAPHRAAAYEASRTALERLKREAPIWKREHYADGGSAWREEEALGGARS
jgi:molybdopterin synthase catalytic subunit